MFINFEGRLINPRLITLIEKADIDGFYKIYIYAGMSSVNHSYSTKEERDDKFHELMESLSPKVYESKL